MSYIVFDWKHTYLHVNLTAHETDETFEELEERVKELEDLIARNEKSQAAKLDDAPPADARRFNRFERRGVPVKPAPQLASPSHFRLNRSRFPPAVNTEKHCPHCEVVIKHRPTPDYRLRACLEKMTALVPPTAHNESRKETCQTSCTCPRDVWKGIFHPEEGNTAAVHGEELLASHEYQSGPAPASQSAS
ncbi:hypothetical protein Clacol_004251 [Clathrus columnatus]|uniref:Uncharacterized protein n=1 Tax=Clathrus columnatus TaxID=1419009 RepID=A0AAV5AAT1_9AGAM|nr:hypothetical protein Clacol_004251 [Clathrus columnatus]